MTSRSAITAFCLLFMLAAQQSGFGQETHSLTYKFRKGQTLRYADTTRVNSTQEMMGQEMKTSTSITTLTRIAVQDVRSDGVLVLYLSADSMRIAMKSPRGDTTITPAEMIGKRTQLAITNLGEILKREILDSVKASGMMRGSSPRESVKFHRFSAQPLRIGEKWTSVQADTTEMMGGKTVNAATIEYVLAGKEKKLGRECLKVTYSGKVSITGKGSMMGMEIFTEGNGTVSGTLHFDEQAGLPVSEQSKFDNEMTAAVTGQQNMTIPISQSGTSHRELMAK